MKICQKILNSPSKVHFLCYCYCFMIYGAVTICLGPMIPFLAAESSRHESEYAVFFAYRTVSYILGPLICKVLIKKFSYHGIMVVAYTLVFVSSTFFNVENFQLQGFSLFLQATFFCLTDPLLNMSLMKFGTGSDKQFYLLIGHSMFGVGSLISPLMVNLFKEHSFLVFGLLILIAAGLLLKLESPQRDPVDSCLPLERERHSKHYQEQKSQKETQNKGSEGLEINHKTLVLLSIVTLFALGEEVTFGSWAPSYAVILKITSKQEASLLSSFFYAFMTLFRVLFAIFPPEKVSRQLQIVMIGKIIGSVMLFVLSFNFPLLTCYLAGALYGVLMAPIYSAVMTVPSEFGFELTTDNYTNLVIVSSFSQTALASVAGWLLGLNPHSFYFSMLLMAFLCYAFNSMSIKSMRKGMQ